MNIEQYIQSINESLHRVVSASQGLSEDIVRWKPSDDQWSVIQVLCHVEEATLYWLNEITLLAKVPGSEWGRGLQHEARLAAVGQAAERNTQDVIRGIEGAKTKVVEVLSALSEDLLKREAPSRNPRFGIKPLSFIIDHLLVEHLETHIKQIHRTVEQYNEANKTN